MTVTSSNDTKDLDILPVDDNPVESLIRKLFSGFCPPMKEADSFLDKDSVVYRELAQPSVRMGVHGGAKETSEMKEKETRKKNNSLAEFKEECPELVDEVDPKPGNQVSRKNEEADDEANTKPKGILKAPGSKKQTERAVSFRSGVSGRVIQLLENLFFIGLFVLMASCCMFYLGYRFDVLTTSSTPSYFPIKVSVIRESEEPTVLDQLVQENLSPVLESVKEKLLPLIEVPQEALSEVFNPQQEESIIIEECDAPIEPGQVAANSSA
mmetsp:Transcript_8405/g.12152  ORF Transcript_8405/g.12152 Transcript_8405/m.12152 type:complete len:268 (+) Transcript_8405:50-853(+)|eukprot:CAMPEP_0202442384 /NCGR_PEP_ID=MMETSP1360-20130828/1831_1 /ASSEMBLY_ACC=CAM_ASM_000848 /TAXON_ID=515479 /ORGANISM="Licmophora paradoxa, Strain CCMP2313" /LENGTH=267 /DNA_ID=CAMNT_0049057733 /DNA_START=50 /DNA_END=853 /DNA_ORIENTATION=-